MFKAGFSGMARALTAPLRAVLIAILSATLFLSLTALCPAASTAWTDNGVPVCTATGDQYNVCSVPDGSGGVVFAWVDERSLPTYKIYAQKLNNEGKPQWEGNGVLICANAGTTGANSVFICTDGSGGAIISWDDTRLSYGSWDVYAQKVDSTGTTKWADNGVRLCPDNPGNELMPFIAEDGAGGAIVVWEDDRNDAPQEDIFGQRVDAAGAIKWGSSGLAVCDIPLAAMTLTDITYDGFGGAIVAWYDGRGPIWQTQVYVQRLNTNGGALWGANGLHVCTTTTDQYNGTLLPDASGGAMIAWDDQRAGFSEYDIYASRINPNGTVIWNPSGVKICDIAGDTSDLYPHIITDGGDGALITWSDKRTTVDLDIYGQKLDSGGNALWAANGKPLVQLAGNQGGHLLTTDGLGGGILAWRENRTGLGGDIFAQRVDTNGAAQWAPEGMLVCGAPGTQYIASIASVGTCAAVIAFEDNRGADTDVYAQRVYEGWGGGGGLSQTFYFAEGYTGKDTFAEYLCLQNPGPTPAKVNITYMFTDGTTQSQEVPVGATTRATVNVNAAVGNDKELSVKIESDQPIVAERPMYFNYNGVWTGGHDVIGTPFPGKTFYFAEGYTGQNTFAEYLCLQNPNPAATTAHITYMFTDGTTKTEDVPVGATTRATVNVNAAVGADKDVSIKIEADAPIVAERPMYFNYNGVWTGGHDVIGIPSPQKSFYFAEGYTGSGTFSEYLCLQNPNPAATTAHITYMFKDGSVKNEDVGIGATTRATVNVNAAVGADRDLSIKIEADSPIVAERPMYFNYNSVWTGGHDVIGASFPGKTFYFAEGYTGKDTFAEYLCLQNPNPAATTAHITYMFTDGTTKTEDVPVGATTRATVNVNAAVGADKDLSIRIDADAPIVAERPMYFNYNGKWTGGHDVVGYVP